VRAAEEGRSIPELSGALAASAVHTGTFAPINSVAGQVTHRPTVHPGNVSQSKLPLILMGLGVLGLVITIVTLFASDSADPAAVVDTKAVDTKAVVDSDVGLPKCRAVIRSNIEAAHVQVDGKPQCMTPCEITVPVDNKAHEIRLSKPGYIDVFQQWRPMTVTDQPPPFPDLKPIASTIEVKGPGKKRGG